MNKELTSLKALDDLRNCLQAGYTMECTLKVDSNFLIIEKSLKALEIIKKDILKGIVFGKKQEISYFVNHRVVSEIIKDKTKYDLLKEVLL